MRILLVPVLLLAAGCVEPADRRPGTWLSGEVVSGPVEDWSFVNEHPELLVETSTWYGIPHSVTILGAAGADGRFFIGARNPETKRWVANVDRDPRVRLKIGGRIHPVRLVPADDVARARAAYAAKYGGPPVPPPDAPPVRYFEVLPRTEP